MKSFIFAIAVSISIAGFAGRANAIPAQIIEVVPGQGTTLNFRPTRDTIRRVWLDNPSQVTVDFDDVNCNASGQKTPCAAQIIHLRRINRIQFPDLPKTSYTGLTVVGDRALYPFRLTFPNSSRSKSPIVDVQSSHRVSNENRSSDALIQRGLEVAVSRNLVTTGDPLWNRVQRLLARLRKQTGLQQAVREAGISVDLVNRLIELGKTTSAF